jgi:hypothetical protein
MEIPTINTEINNTIGVKTIKQKKQDDKNNLVEPQPKVQRRTSDYRLDKIGRRIKAHALAFNKGEDDGQKGVTEQMKKNYKDFVTEHTLELTEEELNVLEHELNEVLGKDAKAGDWIHDFIHSANPQFKGKSADKRKQMALAAYYAAQRNEEAEIEEELKGNQNKLDKNKNGKLDAEDFKKLRKEDAEQIDELKLHFNADDANNKVNAKKMVAHLKKRGISASHQAGSQHRAIVNVDANNSSDKAYVKNKVKDRYDVDVREEVEHIAEAIDANDYTSTSEKSQFGGHRPHVVNKKTGKTMMLGQHAYKSSEHAVAHAKAYLDAYASTGPNAAERAGHAYASTNKDKQMVRKEEIAEAQSHQSKTTMKHVSNPTAGEKKAAKDIKPGIAGYRDRIAMLKSAEARGALKKEDTTNESVFDWKNKPRQTSDSNKTKTYHDVKKTSTGTVYTKQFDKDGMSKGTGGDAAAKSEGQPKRGRGRPKKDKFAEAVEFLLALSEEHFDDLMEEGFDTFIESYEQLDEMSKKALCSYTKKSK